MQKFVIVSLLSAMVLAVACQRYPSSNEIEDEEEHYTRDSGPTRRMSGSECGANKCLVMGFQRFSEPFCDELGAEGSSCRPGQAPDNKTLVFPSGLLEANDVYMQFCPCGAGLVCHEAECKRLEVAEKLERQERQKLAQQKRRSRFYLWSVGRVH